MEAFNSVHVVSCHAEGEVGDVIISGIAPPPGDTLWDQRTWIHNDQTLRNFILNEPRGGVFRHVNLLVPPKNPKADIGWIIMEPSHTPPMSGSNSICVTTVLLETGIIKMVEPITTITLEAPGGLVKVKAHCKDKKVTSVTVQNLDSFVDKKAVKLCLPNLGEFIVDTAYGGDSFVIVNAEDFGFQIIESEAKKLAELGMKITKEANKQLGFTHPTNKDWKHISFCLFAGNITRVGTNLFAKSAVAVEPGKIDRSPTGTAVSARMALLHEQQKMKIGDILNCKSIIGSSFTGKIVKETKIGSLNSVTPEITGRAWITGKHEYMLDPTDPWPTGYRLSDTWPETKK